MRVRGIKWKEAKRGGRDYLLALNITNVHRDGVSRSVLHEFELGLNLFEDDAIQAL